MNKKFLIMLLAVIFTLTGCASIPSVSGSNNSKSHILYAHKTPIQKTLIIEGGKAGVLDKVAGDMGTQIIANAGEVSLGASEIVKAIMGVAGFPYVIIPNLVNGVFKGVESLKTETREQEISKLYFVDGMSEIEATMADHTVIKAKWNKETPEVKINEPDKS